MVDVLGFSAGIPGDRGQSRKLSSSFERFSPDICRQSEGHSRVVTEGRVNLRRSSPFLSLLTIGSCFVSSCSRTTFYVRTWIRPNYMFSIRTLNQTLMRGLCYLLQIYTDHHGSQIYMRMRRFPSLATDILVVHESTLHAPSHH